MNLWITSDLTFPDTNEYVIVTNCVDYRNLVTQALLQMPDEYDIVKSAVFADKEAYQWQYELEQENIERVASGRHYCENVIDYCQTIIHLYDTSKNSSRI